MIYRIIYRINRKYTCPHVQSSYSASNENNFTPQQLTGVGLWQVEEDVDSYPLPWAEMEATVIVEDVNDVTPTFAAAHYTARVPENAPLNSPVTILGHAPLQVHDQDQVRPVSAHLLPVSFFSSFFLLFFFFPFFSFFFGHARLQVHDQDQARRVLTLLPIFTITYIIYLLIYCLFILSF